MKSAELRNEQIWLAIGSLMIIATVALATALVYTRDVMIPFVLAIFVTAVVAPLVDFQVRRWQLPTWLAVCTTLVVVLAILALGGVVVILAVQAMLRSATEYSSQVAHLTQRLFAALNEHHIEVDHAHISQEVESLLPSMIQRAAGTVMAVVSHGLLIVFFSVFLLAGRNPRQRHADIFTEIESTIRGYIATLTLISAGTSVLVGVVLWLLGLRMAWLFALLVFAFTYIPSVGPIIATLLPLPVAIAQYDNPWMIALVLLVPGAIHMLIGNLVTPKLMGSGLELHPVTVLLSLAFWGLLWGIVGMVLAVPIVATVRIVFSRFSTARPLANLLAGQLPRADIATPARSS